MSGCCGVVGAQYVVVVVEGMSMGVCLAFVVSLSLTFSSSLLPSASVQPDHILVIGYVSLAFIGYVLTIPLYCYAILRKRPGWVTPYLIWRLILILLTLALGVSLSILLPHRGLEQEWTYVRVLPPIAFECSLGVIFFTIAFLGMREFGRIQRRYVETVRRKIHENYANIYRAKGNSSYSIPSTRWPSYAESNNGFYAAPLPSLNNSTATYYTHLK